MSTASNNESQVQDRSPEVKAGGTLNRIDAALAKANRFMVYVAAIGLFGMMGITVIDVVGRYIFDRPLMGAYELVGYLMAIAGPWAIGYTQIQKGHIRVDFILKRFSTKGQAVITSFAYLVGIVAFSVLCWRMIVLAQYYFSLKHGNTTDTMGIPIAPFIIVVAIGLGMLALVLLFDLIHTIIEAKRK
ncbi:MAG: TRAP transporter small permease [Dehalococcoidales bacterium]|nr:TRAP transporter small permease [Dehalococcoidales bacterium]